MKKIFGLLVIVVFLLGFAVAAFRSFHTIKTSQQQAPVNRSRPVPRILVTPALGTGSRTIPVLATLKSRATTKVMPEAAGKITFMGKHEGDRVTAGEVIARIESDELQTQLRVAGAQSTSVEQQTAAAAEAIRSLTGQRPALAANEQYWRAEQDRDRQLYQQGALSKAQWEATANKWAEAQGKLAALDAQINASRAQKQAVASQKDAAVQTVALWKVRNRYAEITAPTTGIISARLQETGNYVTPNSVLYHLEDTQGYRLLMQVPQQHAAELSLGQVISLGAAGLPEFRVSRLHPTINELRQKTVEATAEAELTPSATMAPPELDRQFSTTLVTAQASGLVLPPETFFPIPASGTSGEPRIGVYIATDNQAARRELTPLLLADSGVAVVDPWDMPFADSGSTALATSSGLGAAAESPIPVADANSIASPAPHSSVNNVSPKVLRVLRLDFMEHARLPETLPLSEEAAQ